jgi:hypothetical protein
MVVRTRSSGTSAVVAAPVVAAPVVAAPVVAAPSVARAPRRAARFATPSYTESSLRSYKIYTPKRRPVRGVVVDESEPELGSENDAIEAADALASMNYASEAYEAPIPAAAAASASFHHPRSCLNPMRPVTRYIYKLSVYNLSQTSHYNTSYVMYNRDTRTYHVYSVISTTGAGGAAATAAMATGESSLPEPTNTIQTRYTTYMSADSYIMNVVIPCDQREYCVLADFVGVIMDDNDFKQRAFGEDSCYYDIDELWKFPRPLWPGGPWHDSAVEAGRSSDPYLMGGYDRKRMELSHEFPEGFSWQWVRLRIDRDCRATAVFTYH